MISIVAVKWYNIQYLEQQNSVITLNIKPHEKREYAYSLRQSGNTYKEIAFKLG